MYAYLYKYAIPFFAQVTRYNFGLQEEGIFNLELLVKAYYVVNDVPLMHVTYWERDAILPLIKGGQLTMKEFQQDKARINPMSETGRSPSRQQVHAHIPMNRKVSNKI